MLKDYKDFDKTQSIALICSNKTTDDDKIAALEDCCTLRLKYNDTLGQSKVKGGCAKSPSSSSE